MKDVIILGGGIAGLSSAIQLADAGLDVLVIERKSYPFHRVCGEYISNEALPFLRSIGANPDVLNPSSIKKLTVSSPSGATLNLPLEMGAFGVSRYSFDNFLYSIALSKGANFQLNTIVRDIKFSDDIHHVLLDNGETEQARVVIGSFGKRSTLDRQLNRDFFQKKSPYLAVKYHIRYDFPKDQIALHNFKDGYCGISAIENDLYCLCYLSHRDNLKIAGSIEVMQKEILSRNPFLKDIFNHAEFIFESPEVINEISFASKKSVEDHILMAGDAAGMITPLCGNGMAMALHTSKILSSIISRYYRRGGFQRKMMEYEYEFYWNQFFSSRLTVGRTVQQLFGKEILTDMGVKFLKTAPGIGKWIVRQTHGEVF